MIYALPSRQNLRSRLTRWAPPALFCITLCSLVIHQVQISALDQRLEQLADSTDRHHLEDRIVRLEQSLTQVSPSEDAVSYRDLNLVNESLNERITELANLMTAVASQTDLNALLQRVQQIELSQIPPSVVTVVSKPKSRTAKPQKPVGPSLQILGLELRGDERFLSVGPLGTESLEQCQLIRIGETYSGWRLEHIDDQTAVFTGNGQTHRLSIR